MTPVPFCLIGVVLLAIVTVPASAASPGDPSGMWLTETGHSRIRIAPCGGGYCGTIVSTPGKGLDANNPDPALRSRSVIGVQILDARKPDGAGYSGSLYNPNDGKTYSGSMKLTKPDTLEVSGCVLGFLCKSQIWTRMK
ncbi:DUF2147 domain-containing protein [Methylobacterium persicinum]|uniref:Uncharacterized protein (DUF2147 family) n=1 Tax=Methylobacterium persicinum TaxID=374426 RepID=A0ABU0HHD6_9HYPH|nr:DUF2147 domain-containing protein [Methylobacterium persicinum]MDQ0441738.1 uncharacterized protein (DUF2147 family) [Methylobacterium persicinum]GJE39839.1 hypothetical protein KHHGKMAE_3927 [Methylobacterium persicinum]